MNFLQRLIRTAMAALLALLILATALAGVSALIAALAENSVLGAGDSFFVVFAYTLMIGVIPALCVGVPIYAWLWHKGRASWTTATVVGVTLGLPLLFAAVELGVVATAAGAGVAMATHAICRAGANYSFKPRPLRGSA